MRGIEIMTEPQETEPQEQEQQEPEDPQARLERLRAERERYQYNLGEDWQGSREGWTY
jgi:hypothetical protein